MYPEIDESIHAVLSESIDPLLTQYEIFYYGEDIPKDIAKSISILNNGDLAGTPTFDGDSRKETYVLLILVDETDYLAAQRLKRDTVVAIKTELYGNPDFGWSKYMEIGDIKPQFDDFGSIRELAMNLDFNDVSEEYGKLETFDTVNMEGELVE